MSDTLSGTTHPDDNHDHPWWGLPCTVTPCFGARLVQEGNSSDAAVDEVLLINEYTFTEAGLRAG